MTVACDPEMVARVDRLSQSMGLSRSKVLEKIIRNGVSDLEQASKVIGMPGLNALFRLSLAFETEEDAAEIRHVIDSLREHRRQQKQPSLPFDSTAEAC